MTQELQLANHKPLKAGGFLNPSTLAEALECASYISKSSFCPKDYRDKPGDILICLQMGQELEVPPMQALQGIAVINGRPAVWGDLLLALCRRSSEFEYIEEFLDEGTMTAVCKVKRKNEPVTVRSFSKADAEKARLWSKEGPWTNYPKRMLQMRARAIACRDTFTDVLKGMQSAEEIMDIIDYSIIEQKGENLNDAINEAQVIDLRDKLKQCNRSETDLCMHLGIENIELMTVNQWLEMVRILDAAIAKKNKAQRAPINQEIKPEPVDAPKMNEGFVSAGDAPPSEDIVSDYWAQADKVDPK